MSKNRAPKNPSVDNCHIATAKKPRINHLFKCPSGLCGKGFDTEQGANMHLVKSAACRFNIANPHRNQPFLALGMTDTDLNARLADDRNVTFPVNLDEEIPESDDSSESTAGSDREQPEVFPWDDASLTTGDVSVDSAGDAIVPICDPDTIEDCKPAAVATSVMRPRVSYTNEQLQETKLLKILNDANVPHFLFKQLTNWASEASDSGYDFHPGRMSRGAQVKYLEKWLGLKYCRPQTKLLCLPGDMLYVPVTTFDFKDMLYSLLTNPYLVYDLTELDVNPDDPFSRYKSKDNRLSCVNSGQFYNNAYDNLITDPETEMLVPIVWACDETMLSKGGKAGCCPLVFSTSIFGQKIRNRKIAWVMSGMLFDLTIVESAQERSKMDKDLKSERYHAILRRVLESYVKATKEDELKNIALQLGRFKKTVTLKCPTVFVIGDMQGGDKACACVASYTNTLNRLCRKCNVRGAEAGDPFVKCRRISQNKMVALLEAGDVGTLHHYNQYNVRSAWFDAEFGGCRYGIFSAAMPVEPLHALENGIIPQCLSVLFKEEMMPVNRQTLDVLIRTLTWEPTQKYLTSGTEKEMPRLLWKDGVTNLAELTAKAKLGIMFSIVVFSLQDQGKEVLYDIWKSHEKVNDMREVFQMILCYWMWLKKKIFWQRGDKAARKTAETAIRTMLQRIITLWPRESGQGWMTAKMHEQIHVPDDIERNGCPAGYHTGPTEHNHIHLVKRPARTTQRRRETLDEQIGARYADTYIIDTAYHHMATTGDAWCNGEEEFEEEVIEPGAIYMNGFPQASTKGNVFAYVVNGKIETRGRWNNKKTHADFDYIALRVIERYLEGIKNLTELARDPDGTPCHEVIPYCTEYTHDGTVYRSHTNYRGRGGWFDWVMLRLPRTAANRWVVGRDMNVHHGDSEATAKQSQYVPAELHGFVKLKGQEVCAVVRILHIRHAVSSIFTNHWKLAYEDEAKTRPMEILVRASQIVRHSLVLPTNKERTEFVEVWGRDRWADQFSE